MTHRDEVLRQAMALPAEDRAYVVTFLERSLTDTGEALVHDVEPSSDAITGAELLAELDRRSAAYRAGATTARPAADVLADLNARQSSERSA